MKYATEKSKEASKIQHKLKQKPLPYRFAIENFLLYFKVIKMVHIYILNANFD